jgi:hypothetical protein
MCHEQKYVLMADVLECDYCNSRHAKFLKNGVPNRTAILESGIGPDVKQCCCLPREKLDPSKTWTSTTVFDAFQKHDAYCAQLVPEFTLSVYTMSLVTKASHNFESKAFSDDDLAALIAGLRASGHPIFNRKEFNLGSFEKQIDTYTFVVQFAEIGMTDLPFCLTMSCRADGIISLLNPRYPNYDSERALIFI